MLCHCCSALVGFNPRWDAKFRFVVKVPELCLIRFVVRDKDVLSADDLIGQATIPLLSLAQGKGFMCFEWHQVCSRVCYLLVAAGITIVLFLNWMSHSC